MRSTAGSEENPRTDALLDLEHESFAAGQLIALYRGANELQFVVRDSLLDELLVPCASGPDGERSGNHQTGSTGCFNSP